MSDVKKRMKAQKTEAKPLGWKLTRIAEFKLTDKNAKEHKV